MTAEVLERAVSAVRAAEGAMHELTRKWVELPSFTAEVAQVNLMGQALAEAFALPDLELEVVPGAPGFGDHLVWRTPAAVAGQPATLLIGHHDTVFPPGSFEGWQVQDGRAVGPGALDMKGGLAVIHGAIAALAGAGALADLPLCVISVSDEEVGSPSSRPLLESLAQKASCALVFESGRAHDRIVTRRKGTGALKVVMHGRAAHAGNDHQAGINAILALARFVEAAEALTDHGKGITVNVGTIAGGTSKNTVPARAECAVDLRFVHAADGAELVTRLEAAAYDAAASLPGARAELSGGVQRAPLERLPGQEVILTRYAACARAAGLGSEEAGLMGGGSDANTVAAVGLPALDGLGPRGAGFHTTNEYVELASFVPKAEALVRFLLG